MKRRMEAMNHSDSCKDAEVRHSTIRRLQMVMPSLIALVAGIGIWTTSQAHAQDWQAGVAPNTTTVLPQTNTDPAPTVKPGAPKTVKLVAFLTEGGQRIDKGLIWRVYKFESPQSNGDLTLTSRQASPKVRLENGRYIVNASFGRAHITREITVAGNRANQTKKFVLNAGGLRIKALLEAAPTTDATSVRYDIFTDRDQLDNRQLVLGDIKPGLIIRLNSGIYHIVSKYGDANAIVSSDVTVEPGKLTEATVTHSAAKVRFKLVTRSGGEALPDTQWEVKTSNGELIKTSVGALPTHILAPGSYTVVGVSEGQAYQQSFTVSNGQMVDVEVLKR